MSAMDYSSNSELPSLETYKLPAQTVANLTADVRGPTSRERVLFSQIGSAVPRRSLERRREMCEVDEGDLSRRRSLDNARLLTIKLLLESTGLTQRAIGQMLGMKDGSGIGRLMTRLDERLKKSRKLKKKLKDLRIHCGLNH